MQVNDAVSAARLDTRMTASRSEDGAAGAGVLEQAARSAAPGKVSLPGDALLNMELSNFSFNARVLELAMDARIPLLERVRFVAILGGNLDEFFMTRVAGFKRQVALGNEKTTLDGRTPDEQLRLIAVGSRELIATVYDRALPDLRRDLAEEGIEILGWSGLSPTETAYLLRNYIGELDAVITPVSIAPGAAFPHVRNLRPALLVGNPSPAGNAGTTIVELPGDVPRLIPLPGGRRFIPLEEVLRSNLDRLFEAPPPTGAHLFRVTRSGNLSLEGDEVEDVVGIVAENVAKRPFQPVVRLEVEASMPEETRDWLLDEMRIEARTRLSDLRSEDVYVAPGMLDLKGLDELAVLPIPELRYPRQKRTSPLRKRPSIFAQIRRSEVLVRYPTHSFEKTVERFVFEAAHDPKVESIRITLYRTNRASKIVRLLRRAHRNGKRVIALIEVKASFDERRNIEWARALEAAGIRVLYGPHSLKVHAKIASVARRERDGRRLYSYVGTGNLNAATAAGYTDLGILTANEEIGSELEQLFDAMGGAQAAPHFERLLVAPFNMRRRFLELIERELDHAAAGRGGAMTVKLNGLADREMIAALYRASAAGVQVDLIVRGINALRPRVPGLSDNIRVVALAGRYLEHSRIFRFNNAGDPEHFIGSADWRGRNLSRRVEVVTPVLDPAHTARIDEGLAEDLADPLAWDMQPDGSYTRRGELSAEAVEPTTRSDS
ncbi:MAG: polyphosphate kinase 1 [Gemmatimonadota bacterium]